MKIRKITFFLLILISVAACVFLSSCGTEVIGHKLVPPEDAALTEADTAADFSFETVDETDVTASSETETQDTETEAEPDDDADDPNAAPFDGCLFIGDSRTIGMNESGALSGADVFASVGMSVYHAFTEKVTMSGGDVTLEELLSQKSYKKIYIMLGINELGYNFDVTVAKFGDLINKLMSAQPGAKIIIQANLHVTSEKSKTDDLFNNDNINALNSKLSQFADNSSIFYVDANELLDDDEGGLAEEYAYDYSHPLGKYYRVWGDWLAIKNKSF